MKTLLKIIAFATVAVLASCTVSPTDVVTVNKYATTYRGQMKNGKREGVGVLMAGSHVLYSGQWHNNMRQGRGWVLDSLGNRVDGTWDHDTIVIGTRSDSIGVYTGEMDNNLIANGYGTLRDKLGTYYEGQWRDGERTGFGFSSQHRYFRVGEWKHDVYKGERLNYTADRIYGIDISKYQHIHGRHRYGIDFGKLRITHLGSLSKKNISGKADFKVSFIFIKSTEGTTITNPYYNSDYASARSHGYPVGSYHFFTHRTTGAQQAANFLAHTHIKKGDLPPMLDLEPLPSQVRAMGGPIGMWKRVRNWLQIVEKRTGMRPILYISQTFVNRWLDYAPDIKHSYPVWIARYGEYKPEVKLWVWQLAPDGRVRGIVGHVDINVFNGFETEYNRWLNTVTKK